jgi:hypothetical protein
LIQSFNNQSGDVFAAGRAAIASLQRLWVTTLRASLTDDFDVVHFPEGAVKRVTGMGTFGFALTPARSGATCRRRRTTMPCSA